MRSRQWESGPFAEDAAERRRASPCTGVRARVEAVVSRRVSALADQSEWRDGDTGVPQRAVHAGEPVPAPHAPRASLHALRWCVLQRTEGDRATEPRVTVRHSTQAVPVLDRQRTLGLDTGKAKANLVRKRVACACAAT